MARYYLGKWNGTTYVPISIGLCDTTIDAVMGYTAMFDDEKSLREELTRRQIIDGNEPLGYIIEKKDCYNLIFNGDAISYKSSEKYLDANGLYKTLIDEKYNLELYAYLADKISDKYTSIGITPAELKNIRKIVNEINFAYDLGVENYKDTHDKNNLNELILDYLVSSICNYDKHRRTYKTVQGKYDLSTRKIADLDLLLNKYYEVKRREEIREQQLIEEEKKTLESKKIIEVKNYEIRDEDDNLDEKEEFLTADDFILYGMDPEENKKLIRDKNL